MTTQFVETVVAQWGNALAVRINKATAKAAGLTEGAPIRVSVQRGRVVIEPADREPSLEEMLDDFQPTEHGGEVMAFAPVGRERV